MGIEQRQAVAAATREATKRIDLSLVPETKAARIAQIEAEMAQIKEQPVFNDLEYNFLQTEKGFVETELFSFVDARNVVERMRWEQYDLPPRPAPWIVYETPQETGGSEEK